MQDDKIIDSKGKTRWSHYQTAYHFVWIPKYRRKVLTGSVEKDLKILIDECVTKYVWRLLALETDIDHVHCFVSAPPRWSPSVIVGHLKGYTSKYLRERHPQLKRLCEKSSAMDAGLLCWDSGLRVQWQSGRLFESGRRFKNELGGKSDNLIFKGRESELGVLFC